jgi:predicted Zn-dependent protease
MKRFLGAVGVAALVFASVAPAVADTAQDQQTELQIGQQVYQQLQQKGEIITSSPYYNILNPIAARIKRVADQEYFTPFHFILVNETSPNAFAVPGGNVYVTTAMMRFVKNKEELAGVLCHETSHDIHHDVLNLYNKNRNISLIATGLDLLLGGGRNQVVNSILNLGANIESTRFSRQVEEAADLKGAITCAQAGLTPYGLIWLMQAFQNMNVSKPPEFISDHPSDAHRIGALQDEFARNPGLFAKFNPQIACGTPLSYGGLYDQYKGGCGVPRRQTGTSVTATRARSGITRIAPVSASKKVACPAGWKFC